MTEAHTPTEREIYDSAFDVWMETKLTPRQLADELKASRKENEALRRQREGISAENYFLRKKETALTSQRNELLEALEKKAESWACITTARRAIAKVQQGETA